MSEGDEARAGVAMLDADDARARVRALLEWSGVELDLLSSAFRGCTTEQLEQITTVQQADSLPAAYHEFLRVAGQGGVGSAVAEIFPGDDVDYASLMRAEDWDGMRAIAEAIAEEAKPPVDLRGHVVIRLHRLSTFEYVDAAHPDPPVWCFMESAAAPQQEAGTFCAWLERRIARAIKRRYPLRDARFPTE